jgi:hypothetical protein
MLDDLTNLHGRVLDGRYAFQKGAVTGTPVAGGAVMVIKLFARLQLRMVVGIDPVTSRECQQPYYACQSLPQRRVPYSLSGVVSG